LTLEGGLINFEVLLNSLLGYWDVGTKLGDGVLWPKYLAGKYMIMFI